MDNSSITFCFRDNSYQEPRQLFDDSHKIFDSPSEISCEKRIGFLTTLSTPKDGFSCEQSSIESPETPEKYYQEKDWSDYLMVHSEQNYHSNIKIDKKIVKGNTFKNYTTYFSNAFQQEKNHESLQRLKKKDKVTVEGEDWSEAHDKLLLKLAVEFKFEWKKIAKKFDSKKVTSTFIKMRYQELTTNTFQLREKFTPIEDLMIAKYFEKYGSNWALMATHFKNRTPIMLKNRYYSFIRKRNLLGFLIQKVKELENPELEKQQIQNQREGNHFNVNESVQENSFDFIDYNSNNQYDKYSIFELDKIYDDFSSQKSYKKRTESSEAFGLANEKQMLEKQNEANEMEGLKKQVIALSSLIFEMKSEISNLKSKMKNEN